MYLFLCVCVKGGCFVNNQSGAPVTALAHLTVQPPPPIPMHPSIHITQVPMRQVTHDNMESLLLRYKGRYTTVVS
jgi:hypothetical protein